MYFIFYILKLKNKGEDKTIHAITTFIHVDCHRYELDPSQTSELQ